MGVAFLILYYTHMEKFVYLPFRRLFDFWQRKEAGGRKSFLFTEIDLDYEIRSYEGVPVHYLEPLKRDLEERAVKGA